MPLCSKAIKDRLRNLLENAGGNVGIIFAFSLLPIVLATGAALDYGHYNGVRARIQTALDSTGLMLAHNVGLMPSDELLKLADKFFRENFPEEAGVTINSIQTGVTGDKITMQVDASVDTYIMHLAGVPFLVAKVDTEIVRAEDSYEVVLVLDNTGSMAGAKLNALKQASQTLVDNLFGESSVHPLLDMGLVPFSHAVNVGTENKNAAWMDTEAKNPLHKELFDNKFVSQGLTRFKLFDRFQNASWGGCVEARAYPLDVDDTPPSAGNPDTLFVPYFAPDERDKKNNWDSTYPNSYLSDGTNGSDEKRQKNTDKYAPNTYVDLGSYWEKKGPNRGCTANPIQPLTNVKADIVDALGGMKADGYTNITEGLMWGLRVISPGEPFTEGKPYDTKDHHKIIILLTDGENYYPTVSDSDNINKAEYGPYGMLSSGRLVNSSNESTIQAKMNQRTTEACNAVKAKKIDLFTITFQVSDTATENLMRNCATKPDMYYNSPDTSTLKTVFQAIATRISELRISK